jgi:UrcA family protein
MIIVHRFVGVKGAISPHTARHSRQRKGLAMLKIILPFTLLLAAIPGGAFAQDVHAEVRVSYRDLDLRNPHDVKRLDHRIGKAVVSVCSDGSGSTIMDERRIEIDHCIKAKRAELAGYRARIVARAMGDEVAVLSDR